MQARKILFRNSFPGQRWNVVFSIIQSYSSWRRFPTELHCYQPTAPHIRRCPGENRASARYKVLHIKKEKIMRKRLINFVVLFVVLCCIALPIGVVNVHAGSCQGMGCHGLNPHSTGCDYAATYYLRKSVTEVEVSTRKLIEIGRASCRERV